jgi:hypothetical protein
MAVWSGIATTLLFGWLASGAAAEFSFIESSPNSLRTTHGIRLEIMRPAGFKIARPTSRGAIFNSHPYEISLGGFLGRDQAILLHAERVADRSGASNYESLPQDDLPGFRARTQCAAIATADVAEEHDLSWLANHGWNPAGSTLAIKQYFRTTADHNEEVVISLIAKVDRCGDEAAVASALKPLRRLLKLRLSTL